jgi:hypothetical protein
MKEKKMLPSLDIEKIIRGKSVIYFLVPVLVVKITL